MFFKQNMYNILRKKRNIGCLISGRFKVWTEKATPI